MISACSPNLQVHDDLPLVHIFSVNFDPVDPQGLDGNRMNSYDQHITAVHQSPTDAYTIPGSLRG